MIAAAFLDGTWHPVPMAARATHDLGLSDGIPPWLDELAVLVFRAHPTAPRDAPRHLVDLVIASGLIPSSTSHPEVRTTPALVPTRMGPHPPGITVLHDLAALAGLLGLGPTELDWFADVRSLERTVASEPLRHYRYRWVRTRRGDARLLEAPKDRLRAIHRLLLREVVDHIPPHPAATGFRPGGSVHRHAAPHVGRDVVIGLDLEGFFAAVGPGRVYWTFRSAGFPEPVAHRLTGLCTNAVPPAILAAMPVADGADAGVIWRRRGALRHPHLPQGAPTSPALANLAARRLDRRLQGLARRFDAAYTRYADDLAFSGDDQLRRGADRLISRVADIAVDEGFRLNAAKTRVMPRSTSQRLTGLVVNDGIRIPRRDVDRLRAILHDAEHNGPRAANRSGHPQFRQHLLGRIAWVTAADPARGARLRATFDRIDWTDHPDRPPGPAGREG